MKNKFISILILIASFCALFISGCQNCESNILDEETKINPPIVQSEVSHDEINTNSSKDSEQEMPQSTQSETVQQQKTENADEQDILLENNCTLSVQCKIILSNMDKLKKEKQTYVPEDGVIFAEKTVQFNHGETVFDVLLREMKNNKIHMEFIETPMYKSMYIKGINNLYEFDCGELSGWTYLVNGQKPGVGCSQYTLNQGDVVEWIYSCDMGRDIE